jgi:hypothetical protein
MSEGNNHALYISMTDVNVEKNSLQMVTRIFSDDLRDALKNHAPLQYQPTDLSQFFSLNKTIAKEYFEDKLKLFADKSRLALILEGHSVEGDIHSISFQSRFTKPIKRLSVDATFLMELFPTQVNVFKIKNGESTHFLKITNHSDPQSINLQN